jgi:hypothetical protein
MDPSAATVTAMVAELVPSEQVTVALPALTEVITMPLFTAAVATEEALLVAVVAVRPRVEASFATVLVWAVNVVVAEYFETVYVKEPSSATVTAIVAELVPSEQVTVALPALTDVMTIPLFTAALATEAALLVAAMAVRPRVEASFGTVLVWAVNAVEPSAGTTP